MPASRYFKTALILGLLSAIGPFAIDMYLPALPDIGRSLGADVGSVQLTLTVFFVALGIGQLVYGPISDMVGRKPPLYFGLGLFTLASIGCALTNDVQTLIALRFVQGLGAAAGMAIPRAVVRDLHTGTEAARLMSLLMLVFSVSPILAPLVGSGVIALAGWRGVFWAVALAAVAGLALVFGALNETRGPEQRVESSLGSAWRAYALLLRDTHYLGLVGIGSTAMAGFFVFLAGSPFVFINHYGLSPTQYSLAFSFNAVAFIGASQLTALLGRRFGLVRLVRFAVSSAGAVMLVLLGFFLLGGDSLPVLMALYFVASGFMGLVIPTASVLALDRHGAIAGTAGHIADAWRCGRHGHRELVCQRPAAAHGGGHDRRRADRGGVDLADVEWPGASGQGADPRGLSPAITRDLRFPIFYRRRCSVNAGDSSAGLPACRC